jgi:hypothetical protein
MCFKKVTKNISFVISLDKKQVIPETIGNTVKILYIILQKYLNFQKYLKKNLKTKNFNCDSNFISFCKNT